LFKFICGSKFYVCIFSPAKVRLSVWYVLICFKIRVVLKWVCRNALYRLFIINKRVSTRVEINFTFAHLIQFETAWHIVGYICKWRVFILSFEENLSHYTIYLRDSHVSLLQGWISTEHKYACVDGLRKDCLF